MGSWKPVIHVNSCLIPCLKTTLRLLWESYVNIFVLTDLFSAVSCHFPGPNPSLQATCPAAVWDSTPMRMCGCMYAILRQGPQVIQWRCSNEMKKGAFCSMFAEREATHSVAGVGNGNAQHISSFKEEPTLIPLQFYLFINSDGRDCKRKVSMF